MIDRVGYKAPLVVGLLGDAASMVLYAFSKIPLHLALVRVLHGATGALVAPSTMSVMANYSAKERKGRSMSLYGIALASASLIGYPISGLITSHLSFNALFFFGAVVVGTGMLMSLILPRNGRKQAVIDDLPKSNSIQQVRDLLSRKGLIPSYIAIFAQYFTFGGVVTLLPLHLAKLDMGAFEVGMLLTVFSVMFVLVQFPGGVVSDRIGRLPPIVIGLLCIIFSLLMLPLLSSFPLLASVTGLYGIGYGLLFPSISALITDHTIVHERGLATGLFHALLTAGVAIGAPVAGWVGDTLGTKAGILISSVPIAITLVITLIFFKRNLSDTSVMPI